MVEQFIKFVIRPPRYVRIVVATAIFTCYITYNIIYFSLVYKSSSSLCRAEYNPDQYLLDSEFNLAGRKFKRQDLNVC